MSDMNVMQSIRQASEQKIDQRIYLNNQDIEQIRLINEAAAKAAADALAKILDKPAEVTSPSLSLKPIDEIGKLGDKTLLAICDVVGDISGSLLIVHPLQEGLKLVERMLAKPDGSMKEIDSDVVSAYKEFVNMVGGAYLSNIANFLGFRIFPEVPKFIGALSQVKQALDDELNHEIGKLLMMKCQLSICGESIDGMFYIIFDQASLEKIMKTIRDQC